MRDIFVSWLDQWGFPEWVIPDYWLMFTFALVSASLLVISLWRRAGHEDMVAANLIFWGIPALFAGSKVFYFLQFGFPEQLGLVWSQGGLALYGGLFGLLTAWTVYYFIRPYPFLTFLDCVTPGLALGLFVGRIGCFLAGCNGGTACDLPWSVRFPPGTSSYFQQLRDGLIETEAELSLPAHPTQLYESIFGLFALMFLLRLFKRRQWGGEVFLSGMLWYGVFRFATELLRADTGGLHPFEILTFAQLVSLLVGLGSAIGFFWLAPRRSVLRRKSAKKLP